MELGRRRSLVFDRDIPSRTAVLFETLPVGAATSCPNQIPIPIPAKKKKQQQRQSTADRVFDALGLLDDPHLSLLDWNPSDFVAVGLDNSVYLWDAPSSKSDEMVADETVTSVRWAPDGSHIAVGLTNSDIQLWDAIGSCKLRTLRRSRGRCEADRSRSQRVGSLDWNGNILTSGGADGCIRDSDPRVPSNSRVVHTYRGGHRRSHEICGLRWSDSGRQLASGGSDGLVHVWDSRNPDRWLFRFAASDASDTTSTTVMRALAWCPFRDHLLATAGGGGGEVKFWSTRTGTGTCINSLNTGSTGRVSALLWNQNKQELLTSCEGSNHQLTLWEYPSMLNIGQLVGHTNRVLYLAQSPDGCSVASASGGMDETLRVWWNAFTSPMEEDDISCKGGAFGNSYRTLIR